MIHVEFPLRVELRKCHSQWIWFCRISSISHDEQLFCFFLLFSFVEMEKLSHESNTYTRQTGYHQLFIALVSICNSHRLHYDNLLSRLRLKCQL